MPAYVGIFFDTYYCTFLWEHKNPLIEAGFL